MRYFTSLPKHIHKARTRTPPPSHNVEAVETTETPLGLSLSETATDNTRLVQLKIESINSLSKKPW